MPLAAAPPVRNAVKRRAELFPRALKYPRGYVERAKVHLHRVGGRG